LPAAGNIPSPALKLPFGGKHRWSSDMRISPGRSMPLNA
jgi:hypothetical protein